MLHVKTQINTFMNVSLRYVKYHTIKNETFNKNALTNVIEYWYIMSCKIIISV
jgi:hypothetical protein